MSNNEDYPEYDTLSEAIEAVRDNTPLRFMIEINVNEKPLDGVKIEGRTAGDNEEGILETRIELMFGASQTDEQRFQKFNAFADRPKFSKISNDDGHRFEYEIEDDDDGIEGAEELVHQILIHLCGYPENIECTFQPFSTNCPYCDYCEECDHLFAWKEIENCSFESDFISLGEIDDQILEGVFRVFQRIQQRQNWYEQLNPAEKKALFEGDDMERVQGLIDFACEDNDESCQDVCDFNLDLCFMSGDPGYTDALFWECPYILVLSRNSYGDGPLYSMQLTEYWSDEPEKAQEWILSEVKKDAVLLSKIEERISR